MSRRADQGGCRAAREVESQQVSASYEPLLVEIVKFFRGGSSPVSAEETVELFAFMEAADESKRRGGAPVKVADVIAKARAEIKKSATKDGR
jgi:hypothetical protein